MTLPITPPPRSDVPYRLLIGTAALVIIAAGIREAASTIPVATRKESKRLRDLDEEFAEPRPPALGDLKSA
jgi:hypothetical protein